MHGPLIGEFMGTLVLILLGDWRCRECSLEKSKRRKLGLDCHRDRMGLGCGGGHLYAVAFGSPGANINPAITLTSVLVVEDWSHLNHLWTAQFLGSFRRRRSLW